MVIGRMRRVPGSLHGLLGYGRSSISKKLNERALSSKQQYYILTRDVYNVVGK